MAIHATAEAPQKQKPTIPFTMRAAALDRFGGPEVLTIHELPVPTLDANEILIAVHTAGVGSWDADMRGGWWPEGEPSFPLVLGSDGPGTVVDAGRSVRRLAIGDRAYSYSFANAKGVLCRVCRRRRGKRGAYPAHAQHEGGGRRCYCRPGSAARHRQCTPREAG